MQNRQGGKGAWHSRVQWRRVAWSYAWPAAVATDARRPLRVLTSHIVATSAWCAGVFREATIGNDDDKATKKDKKTEEEEEKVECRVDRRPTVPGVGQSRQCLHFRLLCFF